MQTNEWFGACVLWYEKKKNQDEDAGISDCINDCTVKKEETERRDSTSSYSVERREGASVLRYGACNE
jgi:hypothetical protein